MPIYVNDPTLTGSTLANYLQRGAALSGLASDVAYQWEDFFQLASPAGSVSGWTATVVGTGTVTSGTTGERHAFRFASGATAASTAQIRSNTNLDISSSSTDKFYYAARLRVNTAITAQTMAYAGLWEQGAANSLNLGVIGALNTTNYIVQHSGFDGGSALDLGKAIDTNFHVIEAWGQGSTTLSACIDGGGAVSATQSAALTNAGPVVVIRNGTDAVNRSVTVDWLLLVTGRTP